VTSSWFFLSTLHFIYLFNKCRYRIF